MKSSPNEVYPRNDFISGTRNPVTFYYSATCCSTQAKITAMDLKNNYNTYTIDVTGKLQFFKPVNIIDVFTNNKFFFKFSK